MNDRPVWGCQPTDLTAYAAIPSRPYPATPTPDTPPMPNVRWARSVVHNLTAPTCTIASLTNSLRRHALRRGFDLVTVDAKLLAFYALVDGCAPTLDAIMQTSGLDMLKVLQTAQRDGFDVGEQAPAVPVFQTAALSAASVKEIVGDLGSAYSGFAIYDQDEDLSVDWRGAPKPGARIAGYHCMCIEAAQNGLFYDETWGKIRTADADWMDSRIMWNFAVDWRMMIAPT
jgi:hypothetical protein